jgi:hypothetical protein
MTDTIDVSVAFDDTIYTLVPKESLESRQSIFAHVTRRERAIVNVTSPKLLQEAWAKELLTLTTEPSNALNPAGC